MAAPTMTTLLTPMMTPSRVRKLRSLWARSEAKASEAAVVTVYQARISFKTLNLIGFQVSGKDAEDVRIVHSEGWRTGSDSRLRLAGEGGGARKCWNTEPALMM